MGKAKKRVQKKKSHSSQLKNAKRIKENLEVLDKLKK
jgi:hypothetical protein